MNERISPSLFRTLHCPECPLYATCAQFPEQVEVCIDAMEIQRDEAAEAKRAPLPIFEEER